MKLPKQSRAVERKVNRLATRPAGPNVGPSAWLPAITDPIGMITIPGIWPPPGRISGPVVLPPTIAAR